MPTSQQSSHIERIKPLLAGLADLEIEQLIQLSRLGQELSFSSIQPVFSDIIDAAKRLQKVPLDKIPAIVLATLANQLKQLFDILNSIQTFSPTAGPQGRNNLIGNAERVWGETYPTISLLLLASEDRSTKESLEQLTHQVQAAIQLSIEATAALAAKRQEFETSLATFLKEKSAQFSKEGEEKMALVEQALAEVRKAAQEAGVSQTAVYFHNEAEEHKSASKIWLVALALIIGSIIGFSLFGTRIMNWTGTPEPTSAATPLEIGLYFGEKALIAFCLLFALIISAKNHTAARHNYIVNKHRNNALGSFQAFVASAVDDQTKSAVLIQATQSIFAPQTSGYVKTDGENAPASPIIEILRSVGTQTK